jgi:hypothetical protein
VGFRLFFIAPIAQLNLTLFSDRLAESNSRKQGQGKFSVTQARGTRTVNGEEERNLFTWRLRV